MRLNSVEQLAGQRLMVGIRGPRLDRETRDHLQRIRPGSVILFSRNIENRNRQAGGVRDTSIFLTINAHLKDFRRVRPFRGRARGLMRIRSPRGSGMQESDCRNLR